MLKKKENPREDLVLRRRREEKIMADKYQFPVFYTIPGFRFRLVLIGEREVDGRWVDHDTTELSQFSPLDGDAVYRIVERVRGSTPSLPADPALLRGCRQLPDLPAGLPLHPDLGVNHPLLLGDHPH
jgi:hypothetical protein